MPTIFLPTVESLEEYRPWFKRDEVWLPLLQEIQRREHLEGTLRRSTSGSNIVFRSGEDLWIKLCAPLWADEIRIEAEVLERVGPHLGVQLPRVILRGTLEDWPYMVVSHVPGDSAEDLWPDLPESSWCAVARELGLVLRDLHRLPGSWIPRLPLDGREVVRRQRRDAVAHHRRTGLAEEWLGELEPFLAEALPDLDAVLEEPLVLLHSDVTSEHVILRRDGALVRLSGLIDFADSMPGPAMYDLVAPLLFLMRGRPGAIEEFLHAFEPDRPSRSAPVSWELLGWSLLHRFSNLPSILGEDLGRVQPGDFPGLAKLVFPI